MHPRIQEVLNHLDAQHSALSKSVQDIPRELRDTVPGEGRWSVAGVLEHLALVEVAVGKSMANALNAARENGLGRDEETAPVFPTFNQHAILNRSQQIVARETSHPTGLDSDAAWTALDTARNNVREWIISADGEDLAAVTLQHGRFGLINLYQWLLFLGGHEARHAEQVREVGAALIAAQ